MIDEYLLVGPYRKSALPSQQLPTCLSECAVDQLCDCILHLNLLSFIFLNKETRSTVFNLQNTGFDLLMPSSVANKPLRLYIRNCCFLLRVIVIHFSLLKIANSDNTFLYQISLILLFQNWSLYFTLFSQFLFLLIYKGVFSKNKFLTGYNLPTLCEPLFLTEIWCVKACSRDYNQNRKTNRIEQRNKQ